MLSLLSRLREAASILSASITTAVSRVEGKGPGYVK